MEKSLNFVVTNALEPQTSFSPDQVVWIIFTSSNYTTDNAMDDTINLIL